MSQRSRPISVALDMTFANRNRGGSGIYARSLLGALRERDDVTPWVIEGPRKSNPVLTMRWLLWDAHRSVQQRPPDVLHCPTFVAPWSVPIPTVITVHDAATTRFPRDHPLEWVFYERALMPRRLRSAARVITVSEFARDEIIAVYGVDPARVVVISEGLDSRFLAYKANGATEASNVIVFPGAPLGRKNLDIVLRCMAAAGDHTALAKASLQISGAQERDFPSYARLIRQLRLEARVEWLGELPFTDMPAFYAKASVVVYPSLYEGFGFPPLEAMAVGTPVVASNRGSLPEVLDDSALLVDPSDARAVTQALEAALTNSELRRQLRAKGRARAQVFTWTKCAAETVDLYRQLVAGVSEK